MSQSDNAFVVGRRVSVIRALSGHRVHSVQGGAASSHTVKDEPLDLNSDGASVGSNGSSASSSCSEKSHSLYQNEMCRPHHSDRAVSHDEDMHDQFNPATTQFTDDELKPSPLQRKSRKVLVKDEDKDDRYWEKRKKNNMAAKRSREARRSRENQIALRASYLEKDNALLKEELLNVKEELQQMREQLLLVQQQRGGPKQ